MKTLSYSALRSNLASTLDQVNNDHSPLIITRKGADSSVLISLSDFNAYEETAYLMSSPKNAQRLNEAITEIEAGNTINKELIEE